MHWHQLRSQVPQVFQVTSHIVGFRSVLRVVNVIVVAVTIYSILTCTRIACRDSQCDNGSFEVLSSQIHEFPHLEQTSTSRLCIGGW